MSLILWSAVITGLYLPAFVRLLQASGLTRSNYQNDPVPSSGGLVLAFATTWGMVAAVLWGTIPAVPALGLLVVVHGFALVGLLDDLGGTPQARGWRGHLRELRQGRLSPGMVKVLLGGGVAVVAAAVISISPGEVVINASLVALGAALFNQLDVRPGRAGAAFLILALVVAWGGGYAAFAPLAPLVGAVLVYLPWDVRRRIMLGDSGANALGAAWGWSATALPHPWRSLLLALVLALHLLGDSWSFQRLALRRWR